MAVSGTGHRVEGGTSKLKEKLDDEASCSHIAGVKAKSKEKREVPALRATKPAALYGQPLMINIRAAKDAISNLVERASRGEEVVITSDGKPKARLVAMQKTEKPFKVDRALLASIPWRGGKRAEELIREDRDGGY